MFIPESIQRLIVEEKVKTDDIGMSNATVFFYGDKILKVQECSAEAENEYRMMQYLRGKLPVPELYAYVIILHSCCTCGINVYTLYSTQYASTNLLCENLLYYFFTQLRFHLLGMLSRICLTYIFCFVCREHLNHATTL